MKSLSIFLVLFLSWSLRICGAQVTGTVNLDGTPPPAAEIQGIAMIGGCGGQVNGPVYDPTWTVGKNGELANVLIYLEATDQHKLKGPIPSQPAILTHKVCFIVPRVLGIMVGQELKLTNSDPFLHNFHSRSIDNPVFNIGLINKNVKVIRLEAAETFAVICDLHPWEKAWICCLPHPFFAVTGSDGAFKIDPSPPDGEYTVVAWHETGQTDKKSITVKDGKAIVKLSIKAPELPHHKPPVK